MNPTAAPDVAPAPSAIRNLAVILAPVAAVTILADFLLWRQVPGVSMGIFFAALAAMLLASLRVRPRLRLVVIVLALVACCVQAGIEISLSNFLAASALVVALAGEVFQPQLAGLWARFSEVLFGLVTAPFRWLGFTGTFARGVMEFRRPDASFIGSCARAAWVVAPAAILLMVFGGIFSQGNAIFAEFAARITRLSLEWLGTLDLSPARLVFWAFAATGALGLFHGSRAPEAPRWWTRGVPRLPRPDFRLARWQTGAVLVALNALFCFVNTIDVAYLWRSGRLPEGVSHSGFVHQGVAGLIAAVVFSAVIIAGLFQQQDRVVEARWLKNLAHLWVLQNLVLIAGVFLRLKLYVDEFQLTEKRIYVACFLILVSAGFAFLAWFVEKRRTFNWLLGRNAVATLVLFFVLQFPDVAGLVARCNVARWLSSPDPETAPLDVGYLASLGPGAWAQLRIVAASRQAPWAAASARQSLAELRAMESSATGEDWRGWQWRRARGREDLRAP